MRDSTHQEKASTAEIATPGGRETSKMNILDGVERLMIEKGYAGVTDRKSTRLNSSHITI